jgi:hypothetical protein
MEQTTNGTTEQKNIPIDELLQLRSYKKDFIPDPENIIFTIQGKHIGSLQNYNVIAGMPKTCKSTILSALISTAITPADCFGMKLTFPENRKKLAYFDTESSDTDFYRQVQRIKDFALRDNIPERLQLYQVREDSPGKIRKMIEYLLLNDPEISVLIIDGLLDLCINYNDERETRLLTNWIKRITKQYNILLITVLHLGKKDGETLGHLGSNSDRWAQSTMTITRNKENKTYTLEPKFLRSTDDFNPITLMNFNGEWMQVETEKEQEPIRQKRPDDLSTIEHNNLIYQVIKKPMQYKDLIEEIQAITAKGTNYAKGIVKIWIEKNLIHKTDNGYENKKPF